MKNKVEFKRVIKKSILITILILIIFGIFEVIKYKIYMRNFNEKLGEIVTEVLKENPEIDENELIKILNSKENV